MPLADAPLPSSVTAASAAAPGRVAAPSVPAGASGPLPPAQPLPEGPLAHSRPPGLRPDGLSRELGRSLAVAFGIAFVLCPLLEPMPAGPRPDYPLWQLPIDVAAIVAIVAAVTVLWRGGPSGARLGAVAGVLMAVETVVCPLAGHTPVGWWTWLQAGLSLAVIGTSAALMAGAGRRAAEATRARR